MKKVERLRRTGNETIEYGHALRALSPTSIVRVKKRFDKLFLDMKSAAGWASDDEKMYLDTIYNDLIIEGGDKNVWDVSGFDYSPADDSTRRFIDNISNGDIDDDLATMLMLITSDDDRYKETVKYAITNRLNKISEKEDKDQ